MQGNTLVFEKHLLKMPREPASRNTCHDARFAPTSAPIFMRGNALVIEKHQSKMPREPTLRNTCLGPRTSLPQCAFHPTDHVQQDTHPTGNPPPSARKSGAGEARRRVGRRRGRIPSSTRQSLRVLVMNPHADGSAAPGARPRFRPPRLRDPHATSPAPTTTGWREDRCPVVSKRPLHSRAAAKMSIPQTTAHRTGACTHHKFIFTLPKVVRTTLYTYRSWSRK